MITRHASPTRTSPEKVESTKKPDGENEPIVKAENEPMEVDKTKDDEQEQTLSTMEDDISVRKSWIE